MMIDPKTLKFLKALSENNEREWFNERKDEYDAARSNVLDFTTAIITELSQIDPVIPADLEAKSCVMRIYRDVRFSKNKLPYKNNFAIAISATGKNFHGAGYYIHIQPGKSYIAAGSWMPEADQLKSIRQEIDYNAADLIRIIDSADFKSTFIDFRAQESLRTVPKGYDADNENIALLKLKSFIAYRDLTDKELNNRDAVNTVAKLCVKLHPLNVFLNNAIQ